MNTALTPNSEVEEMAKSNSSKPKTSSGGGETVSKVDRFRELLAEIGDDAQPKTIVDEMKKRWNIDMTPQMASTYKGSYLRKKNGVPSGGGRGRGRSGGDISVIDVLAVAGLVKRIGADGVSKLANAMQGA